MTRVRTLPIATFAAVLLLAAQAAPDAAPDSAASGLKSSPPKTTIDPKMVVPRNATPKAPKTLKNKDDAVKPVPPAPSEPDKPGLRPL